MDTIRAKEILNGDSNVQVLYQGSPVWIEDVMDNNVAKVSFTQTKEIFEVPVYKLVENTPAKK